jgi:hypothetical protein
MKKTFYAVCALAVAEFALILYLLFPSYEPEFADRFPGEM